MRSIFVKMENFSLIFALYWLSATFYNFCYASSHLEISPRPRTFTGGLPDFVLVSLSSTRKTAFLTSQVVKVVHWTLWAIYDAASSKVGIVTTLGTRCWLRTSGWAVVTYSDSGSKQNQ